MADGTSFLRSVRGFGYSFEPGVAQSAITPA
jgi:hypothetical protein